MKNVITALGEGRGGEAYRKAQENFKKYATELKNTKINRDLLARKFNSPDYEMPSSQVPERIITSGSREDVTRLRDTLMAEGERGRAREAGMGEHRGVRLRVVLAIRPEPAMTTIGRVTRLVGN